MLNTHASYGGVDYLICLNSELRWPAVDSVKRGNFFVIRKLDKVDSAGRVTFLPGTTFFHINGAMICINVPLFSALQHDVVETTNSVCNWK